MKALRDIELGKISCILTLLLLWATGSYKLMKEVSKLLMYKYLDFLSSEEIIPNESLISRVKKYTSIK